MCGGNVSGFCHWWFDKADMVSRVRDMGSHSDGHNICCVVADNSIIIK